MAAFNENKEIRTGRTAIDEYLPEAEETMKKVPGVLKETFEEIKGGKIPEAVANLAKNSSVPMYVGIGVGVAALGTGIFFIVRSLMGRNVSAPRKLFNQVYSQVHDRFA